MNRFFSFPLLLCCVFSALILSNGCRIREVRETTLRVENLARIDEYKPLLLQSFQEQKRRTPSIKIPQINSDAAFLEVCLKARMPDIPLYNDPLKTESCFKVLSVNREKGEVTLRYNAISVGIKNLEKAFSDTGFGTESFPARKTPWFAPASGPSGAFRQP